MTTRLRVLLVDDDDDERWLIEDELRQDSYDPEIKRVDTAPAMTEALETARWDLLLVDWMMPGFSAPEAFQLYQQYDLNCPIIIISGMVKENTALALLSGGVHDFISKNNRLRLLPAIKRELAMAAYRRREQKSNRLVRVLLDSTAEAIYGLDVQGNATFANPACARMLGYSGSDELIGHNIHELIHHTRPDGSPYPEAECPIYSAFRFGKGTHNNTDVFWRADGSSFPVEYWSHPIHHEDQLIGAVVTFLDITERKQAEQELSSTTSFLRKVIDTDPNFIFVKDRESKFAMVNKAVADAYGSTIGALIGKSDSASNRNMEENELSHQDDLEVINTQQDRFIAEEQITTANGEVRWLQTIKRPLADENGNVHQLLGVSSDITERKRAEEQRDRLIHETGERIKELRCMYGVGESIHSRATLAEIFEDTVALIPPGWQYPEITCTRVSFDKQIYLSECFEESEWKQSENIIAGGERRGSIDVFYREERREQDEGPFLKEERNLVNGIANALGQAIEHKQSQRDHEKAEMQLRHTQKMEAIGQLTGGIAHDFNNILAIILGNIDLLETQVAKDESAVKRAGTIRKSAERAAALTRKLLIFAGNHAIEVVSADLHRVVADMENLIARSLTPEIEVTHRFSENLWQTEINVGDFEDALINLVLNARDAMPGGGSLRLEANNSTLDAADCDQDHGANPGEYVEIAVSDTGEGISQEKQSRVFDPFFTTKGTGKGTGLGLAMVYGFVKRSGGYVKVYSELGIGSSFKLYLPRAKKQGKPQQSADVKARRSHAGMQTVLAVDDEVELLALARTQLEGLGYRVLTATNGNEALTRLSEDPTITLLFSDVVMPGGMNGYQLAELATANWPALKVLLTSGFAATGVLSKSQARFEINKLKKPYSHDELAQSLQTLLDRDESAK